MIYKRGPNPFCIDKQEPFFLHDSRLKPSHAVLHSVLVQLNQLLVARRVILVVAFALLLKILRRQWGPTNGTLYFYECWLSGEDSGGGGNTQILPAVINFV